LQKQLKAIQKEKNRVEQDENLGKSMQKDYDRCTEEVSQEHRAKVLKLLEELQEVKDRF
jgi:aromatic ring hydroxylase